MHQNLEARNLFFSTVSVWYCTTQRNVDKQSKYSVCMQSEISTAKKAHVVPFRMVFLNVPAAGSILTAVPLCLL